MRRCRFAVVISCVVFTVASIALAEDDRDQRDAVTLRDWPVSFERLHRAEKNDLQPASDAVPSAASHFITVVPCRVVDTRNPAGLYGGPSFVADETRTFNIPGGPCAGIPAAAAYSLNFTIVNYIDRGNLRAYPTGAALPLVSTLNFGSGLPVANAAIVPADVNGSIDVTLTGPTNVVIDINGYFVEGVVTNVTPGTGLTGGGTGDVTIGLAPGAVGQTQLGSNAVTTGAIADNAVTAPKIASGQVVKSLKGLTDTVDITAVSGATVTTTGNTIQIGAVAEIPSGAAILGLSGDTTLINAGYTEGSPTDVQTWRATTAAGAPPPREWHTAVWTGTRMIIWGGSSTFPIYENTGGQYDPATDTWTATAIPALPGRNLHSAVWTGSKMIVWGGGREGAPYFNTGGEYDPVANTWVETTTTNAPSARINHRAVWTGQVMIIWGGYDNGAGVGGGLNTGARYSPAPANSWLPVSTLNAPSSRDLMSIVWATNTMVVWGGRHNPNSSSEYENTGGRYDPVGDTWNVAGTSIGAGVPSARWGHTAVWTNSRMIVWGGLANPNPENTGGQYDPVGDTWIPTTTAGAPSARYVHTAVWTGSRMMVWGGAGTTSDLNTGGIYDPVADSWTPTLTGGAPVGRYYHTGVWTGSRMIVWGGIGSTGFLSSGGQWGTLSYYRKN